MAKKRSRANTADDIILDGSELRTFLHQLTDDLKSIADEIIDQSDTELRFESAKIQKNIEQAIKSHPIKSISVVFIIGLLIGYIFTK